MHRRLALAPVITLVLLAACSGGSGGDDDDDDDDDDVTTADAAPASVEIGGWYEVTSQRAGQCGVLADDLVPTPYVWVEAFDDIYYVHYCTSTTEEACDVTPFYDFITPIEGGWSAAGGGAFYRAGCTLSWDRTTATRSGDELTVHSLRYATTTEIDPRDCTIEAAEALTEPCIYETELVATVLLP